MDWLGCLTAEHQTLPVSVAPNAEVTSMPLWLDFTRALGIQTHVLIKNLTDWAIYKYIFCFALYTYKPITSDITINTVFPILHAASQWPWFMCFWKHRFSLFLKTSVFNAHLLLSLDICITLYCLTPHSTVIEASMQTFIHSP